MNRKQFLALPMEIRRSILKDQAELLLTKPCIKAVKDFCDHYEKHFMTDEPQPVHWTIGQILKAGRILKGEEYV